MIQGHFRRHAQASSALLAAWGMLLPAACWSSAPSGAPWANLDPKAKATVVVFLSAKCPCSQSHEPKLRDLAREFGPKGFRFVGIHSNADEPSALSGTHFEAAKLGFPVHEDSNAKWADALGALKTPHAYIIDREGRTLFQGGVDDSSLAAESHKQFLRDALEDVAAGREPRVALARALGCMIKRN